MYVISDLNVLGGDALFTGQMIVYPNIYDPSATASFSLTNNSIGLGNDGTLFQMNGTQFDFINGNIHVNSGGTINIADLAGAGDRSIGVDASGNIIELTGGGGSFNITDDFSQTNPIVSGDTLTIVGRPFNNVIKTYFSSPNQLEIRLEGGSQGQVIGYDSDFGAAWKDSIQWNTLNDNLFNGVPYVITHGYPSENIMVQVYKSTGVLDTTAVIKVNVSQIEITVTSDDTYRISYIYLP